MKKNTLAFGTKINCTFAALAAVLALTVGFGFSYGGISVRFAGERHRKDDCERFELVGNH